MNFSFASVLSLPHTLLAFFVALGTLVVVHELGHYWAARLCGVKVLRFSVGMGRIIFSRRFGPDQTEWALSLLPLGGYVKMLDARETDVSGLSAAELRREFTRQSVWRRIIIVAAGPLANFVLASLLFTGLYLHGVPEARTRLRAVPELSFAYQAGLRGGEIITAVDGYPIVGWSQLRWKVQQAAVDKTELRLEVVRDDASDATTAPAAPATVRIPAEVWNAVGAEDDFLGRMGLAVAYPQAIIGKVNPDGAAAQAGLQAGDRVDEVNGVKVPDSLAFVEQVRAAAGQAMVLDVMRDGHARSVTVVPELIEQKGKRVGRIGVEIASAPETVNVSLDPLAALQEGAIKTWDTSVVALKMMGKMLVGEVSWKNMAGPITIADYAGQTARIGLFSYISFIAFVSINLGIVNLLPIPVLDGGLLLYYSLEVLTGRPLSARIAEMAQRAGISILMLLMAVVVFNDIRRLMS